MVLTDRGFTLSFVKRGTLGALLAVVLCLSSMLGAEAIAGPPSGPAARHRRHARHRAGHPVAHRRGRKRANPSANRLPPPSAMTQTATSRPAEVAFVTLTTAAEGTSFYVDNRRVGSGSTVHHSMPPGYHRVQAVHPSGARWQKNLSFEAGDDRKLTIYW
jgi:hypothetical protein